ncbi:MAG: hypothetical protein B6D64_02945 [Bacteroidetes bacterium 4484_276]|nr:MAG: hypothetical protein B6D64_02945 [Bacteroidetes bacterium 4484_276]
MKRNTITIFLMFVFSGFMLSAQEVRVEPGTSIKVDAGTTLDISDGDLVLESDENGDASLIDIGAVSYQNGEAKVQRYLTEGQWHLISAPVGSVTSGMFTDDFLQYHTESSNLYTDVSSLNYGLNVMQGYALWTVDAQPTTEVFSGTTNTGSQDFDFTQSAVDKGWNLVGNPYPSAIDWDAVTIPAELNGAIWLFDPTEGNNGNYVYYIKNGGANTATQFIPSGQGFFVRATGGAGTLALTNDCRTHSDQAFYKNSGIGEMLLIKATGNGITSQTAIRFIEDATQGNDRLYDVYKIISGSTDVPNVYTKCEDQNMAINTLPSVKDNETVPMYFEAGMDGTYTFNASEMETLAPEVPVYLEDVALGYFQDLRLNPEYSFNYQNGQVRNFRVHFKEATSIDENENPLANAVNCYLSNGILHVDFISAAFENSNPDAQIEVFGITGQKLISRQTHSLSTEIPFTGSSSIYLVNVSFDGNIVSKKIINQ